MTVGNVHVIIKDENQCEVKNSVVHSSEKYHVTYCPINMGLHTIQVLVDNSETPQSPYSVKVANFPLISAIKASGPGLVSSKEDEETYLTVTLLDKRGNPVGNAQSLLQITIKDSQGNNISPSLSEKR